MDPIQIVVIVISLLVGGGTGFVLGRGSGRASALDEGRAAGLVEGRRAGEAEGRRIGVEEGRRVGLDEGKQAGAETARKEGFDEGVAHARRGERDVALREAVGRVSAFLHSQVRAPLAGAADSSDEAELRERIERALGSLEDLDFFIAETGGGREGADLAKLAQAVSREFAGDQDVAVRVMLGQPTVRAEVNPQAIMDALYLILHNAARFGDGNTVDLTVEQVGNRAKVTVRDRGPGFTEEAFRRAFDPFYSTSEEGLGLGLPHARKIVEDMGGAIELRNMPDGGAEVEVSLPVTGLTVGR